jgi:uncharacterized coiled-coil DUF342 family protein
MFTKEKEMADELRTESERLKIEIMAKLKAINNLEEIITEFEGKYQKVCEDAD